MAKSFVVRTISLVLALVTVFSIAVNAVAATKVNSVDCAGDKDGGYSKCFYVKTQNTNFSKKITITCGKGTIIPKNIDGWKDFTASIYGCYEITVSYWNGSKWVKEDNFDIYNKSSRTITFNRKNTYYKVTVYSWRTLTIMSSYLNKGVLSASLSLKIGNGTIDPVWKKIPTCKATPKSNCSLYTSRPF